MQAPDRLPETQDQKRKLRPEKIVLYAIAIGAVIAMVVIQVKKMLDSVEEKPQKPVAAAPEKVEKKAKTFTTPRPPVSAFNNKQAFGTLVENPLPAVFREPETVDEACDALKYGDPAYYSVYPALKFVMDSQEEEELSFFWPVKFYNLDLGKIAVACDLDSNEIMEILKGGIEQGDIYAGKVVEDIIDTKCVSEFRDSLDDQIIEGKRERDYDEKCQQFPDSLHFQCMERDSVYTKIEECHEIYGKKIDECLLSSGWDFQKCYSEAYSPSRECDKQAMQECDGLSLDSPRMECQREVDKEYNKQQSEWMEECKSRRMRESGFDPDEVKMLTDQEGDVSDGDEDRVFNLQWKVTIGF